MLGVVSAGKKTVIRTLAAGYHVGLVPDGIAGIFYAREPAEVVPVKNRMGAAKLALETATTLQPCYLFGNSQPLDIWYDQGGRMQRLSRFLRVCVAPIWGRWGLVVPRRQPITWALGEALHVQKAELPIKKEELEAVHKQLLDGLQQTYKLYAGLYGWGDRPLLFV
jgi:hypothetical protein